MKICPRCEHEVGEDPDLQRQLYYACYWCGFYGFLDEFAIKGKTKDGSDSRS